MDQGLETTLLYKVYNFGSTAALMVCLLPLFVILALPFMESTLLATPVWHALERPTFAFLLLNYLIITIMARSKLQEYAKVKQEAESKSERMGQVNGKGDKKGDLDDQEDVEEGKSHTPVKNGYDSLRSNVEKYFYKNIDDFHRAQRGFEKESKREPEMGSSVKGNDVVENVIDQSRIDTPQKNDHDFYTKSKVENFHTKNTAKNFLRKCWSLNAALENKSRNEAVKFRYGNEKKTSKRARPIASRRNAKIGLHPHKPDLSSDLKEKQLLSGSLVSFHASDSAGFHREKPTLPSSTFQAATAHPSMEDVWAAIMSSNKVHNCTTPCMHPEKRSREPSSRIANQPQPAAAATRTPTQPAVAVLAPASAADPHMSRPPAAAISSSSRAATAATPKPNPAKKSLPAAAGKLKKDGKTEENDGDVKELNLRAEQFITRFNCQMRLQREESLQRQKKPRGRRPCTYADTQSPRPMQRRGLLMR